MKQYAEFWVFNSQFHTFLDQKEFMHDLQLNVYFIEDTLFLLDSNVLMYIVLVVMNNVL